MPFTFRDQRRRSLGDLARGLGASFVRDGLADVDTARGRVLTSNGDFISYDALLVAVGARVGPAADGMELFTRAPSGIATLAQLIRDLEDASVRRAAFVVPRWAAWPVDGYELAFIARLAGPEAELTVVTAEEHPLESLGTAASEALPTSSTGRASSSSPAPRCWRRKGARARAEWTRSRR